jgi:membrane protease subunit HflC
MVTAKRIGLLILAVILFILITNSFFKLSESEQAIITQFGKPVGGSIKDAGLHFKIPLIQALHRFEKRILNWDSSADQIPTADKKYIWLDTTARWRITDPLMFYTSVGNVRGAQTRLDDIIDSASRDIVSRYVLVEVVRDSNRILDYQGEISGIPDSIKTEDEEEVAYVVEEISTGREKLTRMILQRASELVPQYGIELLDVQVKRLNYIEDVRKKVYERMISERQRIASKYRSEGEGKKAEIVGMKEKELNRIYSEAYRRSETIRGEADAKATKIYADAYRQDPEFYSFLKTLDVYKRTMGQNDRVILTTDTELFRYLRRIERR